jgi:lipoprotein-anchoring transpeptidase ErfK/SrfK
MSRMLTATAMGAVAACVVAGLAQLLTGPPARPEAYRALPAPPKPTIAIPEPLGLGDDRRSATVWTSVERGATARTRPDGGARAVAQLPTRTPEGTANAVLVTARASDAHGRVWVRARLPVLPNGTTGWLPRSALGAYQVVHTRLIVDLHRERATLLRNRRPVFRTDIGVGRPRWPTPRGQFYIRNRLTRYRSPAYGPLAFGTSARSDRLTDWPAGGFIGIHGTDQPGLLPGRVSHGCIRMRNEDILRLGRMMPVGTPVTIR